MASTGRPLPAGAGRHPLAPAGTYLAGAAVERLLRGGHLAGHGPSRLNGQHLDRRSRRAGRDRRRRAGREHPRHQPARQPDGFRHLPGRRRLARADVPGLTFGSIAALFGLTHGLIDKAQYTELVTVVILSAFVPTLIAQQLFRPVLLDTEEEEALGEEDLSIVHHRPATPPGGSRTRSAAPSPDPADPSSR